MFHYSMGPVLLQPVAPWAWSRQGTPITRSPTARWKAAKTRSECMLATAAVLEACRRSRIKLGRNKAVIAEPAVKFAGYVVDEAGLRPDPDRLQAIKAFPRPANKTDLRSFFGLAEQLAAFNMSKAGYLTPLRYLLQRGQPWEWTPECEAAFLKTRQEMSADARLARYDPNKPLFLYTDASKLHGLGFALLQEEADGARLLLEAGSRSLSSPESRYAVVELEMAAIAFAVRKAHCFLYARDFTVVTDHRPLLGVFDKGLAAVDNARLANMRAKMTPYSFTVEWQKGGRPSAGRRAVQAPNGPVLRLRGGRFRGC